MLIKTRLFIHGCTIWVEVNEKNPTFAHRTAVGVARLLSSVLTGQVAVLARKPSAEACHERVAICGDSECELCKEHR